MKRFAFLALAAIASSGCHSPSSISQMQRDTSNLTRSFATLEKYQVETYRNQDWCKNIVYERGKFSEQPDRSTCNLFQGQAQAFDKQALDDFNHVRTAIYKTQVDLLFITALEYSSTGTLIGAKFHLNRDFERYAYVYAPNYTNLPPDIENERQHIAIDENWFAVLEDWN